MPDPFRYECDHDTEVIKEDKGKFYYCKEVCRKCGKTISTWTEPKFGEV